MYAAVGIAYVQLFPLYVYMILKMKGENGVLDLQVSHFVLRVFKYLPEIMCTYRLHVEADKC